jgi:hypothetical protein
MTWTHGAPRAPGRGRRPALAALLVLHAAIALVALPAVHALVHRKGSAAVQVHGSTEAPDGGALHQATCPGCTLVRAPSYPTTAVGRLAVPMVVVVHPPAAVSDSPTPLRSPPLGGRAPPLV